MRFTGLELIDITEHGVYMESSIDVLYRAIGMSEYIHLVIEENNVTMSFSDNENDFTGNLTKTEELYVLKEYARETVHRVAEHLYQCM